MDKKKLIKITPAMISAGVRVLRESGALAVQLSSDSLLVRDLLETVLLVYARAQKNSPKKLQARRN